MVKLVNDRTSVAVTEVYPHPGSDVEADQPLVHRQQRWCSLMGRIHPVYQYRFFCKEEAKEELGARLRVRCFRLITAPSGQARFLLGQQLHAANSRCSSKHQFKTPRPDWNHEGRRSSFFYQTPLIRVNAEDAQSFSRHKQKIGNQHFGFAKRIWGFSRTRFSRPVASPAAQSRDSSRQLKRIRSARLLQEQPRGS